MGQLVSLAEWAAGPNGFKEPPCKATLHRIAKTRQTYPPAVKQGRRWVVDEEARFIGMVERVEISNHLPAGARTLVEKALNGSKTP
ncbi:hypothetical protein JHW33_03155 [Rahnella aceris]|uniref:excisionase n=1 Tax=Rahnella sp. (strain Y9602) TaxID=2703885 RepID=UPI001902D272|nr:excisionase [Rahnella aceris]QQN35657.1 hypothetical protein JHW33_03155 [Rahnella aceris]